MWGSCWVGSYEWGHVSATGHRTLTSTLLTFPGGGEGRAVAPVTSESIPQAPVTMSAPGPPSSPGRRWP